MEVAIGHQESAVIVGERTLGLDHPETIRNYVRWLGAMGSARIAFRVRRADYRKRPTPSLYNRTS